MKKKAILVLLVCVALFAACNQAENSADESAENKVGPIQLADPIAIMADGVPIDVKGIGHSAPCYADITGDDIPDLLVGQFEDGKISVYKNYGTVDAPEFKDFEYLKAGGELAVIPPS